LPKTFKRTDGVTQWAAVLADPPYTESDADKYHPKAAMLPTGRRILQNGLDVIPIGGRVGILHYHAPRPPKDQAKFIALITVFVGFENRARVFSVFERRK
jgi:hypothetical protein